MDSQPPHQRPPHSPQYTGPLPYQSPGAHQKSQWVTDEQATGKILIGCAIVVSVVGTILGAIAAAVWFLLGF